MDPNLHQLDNGLALERQHLHVLTTRITYLLQWRRTRYRIIVNTDTTASSLVTEACSWTYPKRPIRQQAAK